MDKLQEGDYVEHWEQGIGKIVKTDQVNRTISVVFKDGGQISLPDDKTKYLKKLNPEGLLAHFFEKAEDVHQLIEDDPTKIVKLLIHDEGEPSERKIDRSRIKALLTKGGGEKRGWRRDFSLIDEQEWKKWWTKVNKKLKTDPWFDTTSKKTIILREEPVSQVQELYQEFLPERTPSKKLALAEKLIAGSDKAEDSKIIQNVSAFLTECINAGREANTFELGVFCGIQARNKGIEVEGIIGREYELALKALLKRSLSPTKQFSMYSLFVKLPSQNPVDHLIILLGSHDKLAKSVEKQLKSKTGLRNLLTSKICQESFTKEQIDGLENLSGADKEEIRKRLEQLGGIIEGRCKEYFFSNILLCEELSSRIKDTIAVFVADSQLINVIYRYLNEVSAKSDHIPYLDKFLHVLSPENVQFCLKNILLTEQSAVQRPQNFLAAFHVLANSPPSLTAEQINSLFEHVNALLSNENIQDRVAQLKLKIGSITAEVPNLQQLKDTLSVEELGNIARNRVLALEQRIQAAKVLVSEHTIAECASVAEYLLRGPTQDDFLVLKDISVSLCKNEFRDEFLQLLINNLPTFDRKLYDSVNGLIEGCGLTTSFAERVLAHCEDDVDLKHQAYVGCMLLNEGVCRQFIKVGLKKLFSDPTSYSRVKKRLAFYCPDHFKGILEEASELYRKSQTNFKSQLQEERRRRDQEVKEILESQEESLNEATHRTSQRYEEYMNKLVPALKEIERAQARIKGARELSQASDLSNELLGRLAFVHEEIEWVLRKLKIF